jgi:hypothetical protein
MLVCLEISTTLKFYKNLGYTSKLNIRGFLVGCEVAKKDFLLTFLLPWIMTFHKEGQQHSMLELLYNEKQKNGHSIVGNTFGNLKQIF